MALEGEQQSRARLEATICRGPYRDPFGAGLGPGSSLSASQADGDGRQVPWGHSRVLLFSLSLRVFGPVSSIWALVLCRPRSGAGSITRVSPRDHGATHHIPIS